MEAETASGHPVAPDGLDDGERALKFLTDIRALIVVAAVVVVGASISPALNGCASDGTAGVRQTAQVGTSDAQRWSDGGNQELSRFNAVFNTLASDPDNTRQLKHFRDAYKRIRASYVEEIPDTPPDQRRDRQRPCRQSGAWQRPGESTGRDGSGCDDREARSAFRLSECRGTARVGDGDLRRVRRAGHPGHPGGRARSRSSRRSRARLPIRPASSPAT